MIPSWNFQSAGSEYGFGFSSFSVVSAIENAGTSGNRIIRRGFILESGQVREVAANIAGPAF